MAKLYTKQTWTDEVLAGEERYEILEDDGTPISENVQINLATAVAQAGTAVDAERMNHIENGLDAVDTRLDGVDTWLNAVDTQLDAVDTRLDNHETGHLQLARYFTTAGQSLAHNTMTVINYNTKVFDPNKLVTTGATWRFTAAVAGYYAVSAGILLAAYPWPIAATTTIKLFRNGEERSTLDRKTAMSSGTNISIGLYGSDVVQLAAGDYIDIRVHQGSGETISLTTTSTHNHVAIWKV